MRLKILFTFRRKRVSKPNAVTRFNHSESSVESKFVTFRCTRSRENWSKTHLRVVFSFRLIQRWVQDWLLTNVFSHRQRKILRRIQFSMFTKAPRWSMRKIITTDCFLKIIKNGCTLHVRLLHFIMNIIKVQNEHCSSKKKKKVIYFIGYVNAWKTTLSNFCVTFYISRENPSRHTSLAISTDNRCRCELCNML